MKPPRPLAAAGVAVLLSCRALGQPAFESVSLAPSPTGETKSAIRAGSGNLTAVNASVRRLLTYAYGLRDYQLAGPAWIDTENYDLTAKTGASASNAQLRLMLQTLLENRFHLKSHRETRQIPGYGLFVAEGGPRLPDPKEEQAFQAAHAGSSPFRPGFNAIFTAKDLPGFADRLAGGIGRPVEDRTGIQGRYWFQLEWEAGSLLTAIQEQLGLKLEEQPVSAEVLVIDHIGKPTAQN